MKTKTRDLSDEADRGRDSLGVVRALTGPYVGMGRRSKWRRRIKELPSKPSTCFHLMSRICDGLPMFDDTDKEALVIVLRKLARFSGIKLLTYCVMGNHFHALVRVPEREEWLKRFAGAEGEERLMQHLRLLYSKEFVVGLKLELADWHRNGKAEEADRCIADLKRRFCDISVFMRAVKLRFTRWFNKRHGRRGALWMGRFQSVLVEGEKTARHQTQEGTQLDALKVMAAYIDLNPVRAELVEGAEDYRWSGWTAALGGDRAAMDGLCDVVGVGGAQWEQLAKGAYQSWVSETRRQVRARKAKDGEERDELGLMERVRAFSAGLAVGTEVFVEEVFADRRDLFGPKRSQGARPVDGGGGVLSKMLCTLRDLRGTKTSDLESSGDGISP